MAHISTYAFLDLETTGFPWQEGNQTKVTELAVVAVSRKHLLSRPGTLPRVLHKLVLCLRPDKYISPVVHRITGLSNDSLRGEQPFTAATVRMINAFLENLAAPVCLVVHNGNKFDYPILRAEVINSGSSLPDDLLCMDSIEMFRNLPKYVQIIPPSIADIVSDTSSDNERFDDGDFCEADLVQLEDIERKLSSDDVFGTDPTLVPFIPPADSSIKVEHPAKKNRVSYKLGDLYESFYGRRPEGTHRAETDSVILLECCSARAEEFVDWSMKNAIRFNMIPPMERGKKFPPMIPKGI